MNLWSRVKYGLLHGAFSGLLIGSIYEAVLQWVQFTEMQAVALAIPPAAIAALAIVGAGAGALSEKDKKGKQVQQLFDPGVFLPPGLGFLGGRPEGGQGRRTLQNFLDAIEQALGEAGKGGLGEEVKQAILAQVVRGQRQARASAGRTAATVGGPALLSSASFDASLGSASGDALSRFELADTEARTRQAGILNSFLNFQSRLSATRAGTPQVTTGTQFGNPAAGAASGLFAGLGAGFGAGA